MTTEDFKQKYLPLANKLYNMAFRVLRNKDEASDAVQDTFLKLWEKRNETTNNNLEALCIITLKNTCFDAIRKRKPQDDLSKLEHSDNEKNFLAQIEWHDNWIMMKKMIEKLPEQQRTIIKLRHIQELEINEIAQQTGLSEVNVRTILSRTRKELNDQFLKMNG